MEDTSTESVGNFSTAYPQRSKNDYPEDPAKSHVNLEKIWEKLKFCIQMVQMLTFIEYHRTTGQTLPVFLFDFKLIYDQLKNLSRSKKGNYSIYLYSELKHIA